MPDLSAMMLNLSLTESALNSVPKIDLKEAPTAAQSAPVDTSANADQGVYAVKGDSLYKEEMDTNSDGVVTNAEMVQYYAKVASDYGSDFSGLTSRSTENVVTTAQAANAYMANEAAFSAGATSYIEISA